MATRSTAANGRSLVYIVDDEPAVRRALTRVVRRPEYEVVGLASAEQFLALARPHDGPACVVADLVLPGLSGLELQQRMREQGLQLPIIFVSGRGDVGSGVRAMKGGAVDFLEKPVSQEVLCEAIERALERDRGRRAERARREALAGRADRLTPRERQVFSLVAGGCANKEVGARLGTTEKTVKVHRARVMEKMEAGSLAELVRMADTLGLTR